MAKRTTQTTRINGAKVRLITNSAGKITIKPAPIEEWLLQAAAVRALKAMPEYAATADDVAANTTRGLPSFTLAGDMNAARRSAREQVKAAATGIAAGDPDLRLYLPNGMLRLIEYKNAEGRLTDSQKERHPLLAALSFPVETVKVSSEEDAASRTVGLVTKWLYLDKFVISA
ncbi:VRR-NUC domain-containing protein [Rhizobium sp. 16-449-1b]|uniref:VRR-NUC domain-containing protein n=1 Tax=Rhizobium sp. 16-449-1b TaxID=2819989 RepID=UPI001ADB53B1|nr:VRR-NUC domain-containing protein [Rhizobium sp. 16-449-1b]MBO9194343.1 VRR-NUC domain-containing protein [Rhizobium sp. 16-449-1b]